MKALNADQRGILTYLATHRGDDSWNKAVWVAEGCGHYYDTPWASTRLRALVKRGLVEKDGSGSYYRITEAGRGAIA